VQITRRFVRLYRRAFQAIGSSAGGRRARAIRRVDVTVSLSGAFSVLAKFGAEAPPWW